MLSCNINILNCTKNGFKVSWLLQKIEFYDEIAPLFFHFHGVARQSPVLLLLWILFVLYVSYVTCCWVRHQPRTSDLLLVYVLPVDTAAWGRTCSTLRPESVRLGMYPCRPVGQINMCIDCAGKMRFFQPFFPNPNRIVIFTTILASAW